MKKRTIFLLLFVSIFFAASSTAKNAKDIYSEAINSTCHIKTKNVASTNGSQGSGFILTKEGHVVTNLHVIEDAEMAKVYCGNKVGKVTKVLKFNKDIDLVVLQTSLEGLKPLDTSKKLPQIGSDIYAIGSPIGLRGTITEGIVTNLLPEYDGLDWIQTDTPISSGSSGGPVLNSEGKVIGISTFILTIGQNINFVLPIKHLEKLNTLNKPLPITKEFGFTLLGKKTTPPKNHETTKNPIKIPKELLDKDNISSLISITACPKELHSKGLFGLGSTFNPFNPANSNKDQNRVFDKGFWYSSFKRDQYFGNSAFLFERDPLARYHQQRERESSGLMVSFRSLCIEINASSSLKTEAYNDFYLNNFEIEYAFFEKESGDKVMDCISPSTQPLKTFKYFTSKTKAVLPLGQKTRLHEANLFDFFKGCLNGQKVDLLESHYYVMKARIIDYNILTKAELDELRAPSKITIDPSKYR